MNQFSRRKTMLTAGGFLLIATSAVGFQGGGLNSTGGYRGVLPADWFDAQTDPCRDQPITVIEDDNIIEYQVDVSAVANDGDDETFARCVLSTNDPKNRCIVGTGNGQVVTCTDTTAPHVLPSDGDMLYIYFQADKLLAAESVNWAEGQFLPVPCEIYVGTHDRFGEADPACRPIANNCQELPINFEQTQTLVEGQCYSYDKSADPGTLYIGTWWPQGVGVTVTASDTNGNEVTEYIQSGVFPGDGLQGLDNTVINFTIDIDGSATSQDIQVSAWQ